MPLVEDEAPKTPVSPKVKIPFYLGLIALVAQTAATMQWDETNWIMSAVIVLYAAAGYFTKDPLRKV